jgi:hypothetical protein
MVPFGLFRSNELYFDLYTKRLAKLGINDPVVLGHHHSEDNLQMPPKAVGHVYFHAMLDRGIDNVFHVLDGWIWSSYDMLTVADFLIPLPHLVVVDSFDHGG